MKRLVKKTKGLIKGAPTAVLISAGVHLVLLGLAGSLVVFTAIKKAEKKFVPPPPVDRPKMDLKKPKVKVKKTVKPRASQRITSRSVQAMTDVALPPVATAGSGLSGGVGGFEMLPDPNEMSLFGGTRSLSIGNDFEGTMYAFNLDRRGKEVPMTSRKVSEHIFKPFTESGWNPRVLAPYYRAPQKIYSTHIMIPPTASEHGPAASGASLSSGIDAVNWMFHFKGNIARPEGGRFRFWATADNFLAIRINKKVVIACGFGSFEPGDKGVDWCEDWAPTDEQSGKYRFGHAWATVSDWFELEPGVPAEMEYFFGAHGGLAKCMVNVEQEGEDYDKNREGMPILPAFKTAEFSEAVKETILFSLIEGESDLDSDLMFNTY